MAWTPSKTSPEAMKIRLWRPRGPKSGPSRAPVPKKSEKKSKNPKIAPSKIQKSYGTFAEKSGHAVAIDRWGGTPPHTSI